jgi:hypothetical protein
LIFALVISCSCVYIRPGEDSQDRTPRTGQAEQDRQAEKRTGKIGQAEQDRQNRTDSQNRTGKTEQAEQDRQNRTGKVG